MGTIYFGSNLKTRILNSVLGFLTFTTIHIQTMKNTLPQLRLFIYNAFDVYFISLPGQPAEQWIHCAPITSHHYILSTYTNCYVFINTTSCTKPLFCSWAQSLYFAILQREPNITSKQQEVSLLTVSCCPH